MSKDDGRLVSVEINGLRRELPQLRVLIVEKAEKFDEKVGEATTEMSGMFLTRRLALWSHLELEHLPIATAEFGNDPMPFFDKARTKLGWTHTASFRDMIAEMVASDIEFARAGRRLRGRGPRARPGRDRAPVHQVGPSLESLR